MSWFSLDDLTASNALDLPWPASGALDGIDPRLAWLDASHFAGAPPGALDPAGRPLALPLLVKLSTGGADTPGSVQFGVLPTAAADVLQRRAGAALSLPGQPAPMVIELPPQVCVPHGRDGHARLFPAVAPGTPPAGAPPRPVIAVIDDGCPFARAGLRRGASPPSTRVQRLWDQGAEAAPLGAVPARFGYGLEWDAAALQVAMAAGGVAGLPGTVDEDACYAHLDMALVGETFRHGAHMLGLAAGDPDPWAAPDAPADAAAHADIYFVQLPQAVIADTSGSSLPVHVLDALHWIDDCTRVPDGQGGMREVPVVINLSFGASAGPHDGSRPIEQAIDSFLAGRRHAIVVTAAGNARAWRQHASWRIDPGASVTLDWGIASDDATDSFIELWWHDDAAAASAGALEVQLVPPGADAADCPFVAPGQARFLFDGDDRLRPALAGVVSMPQPAGKGNARCVLLCTAPTARGMGAAARPLAPAGHWQLNARLPAGAAAPVQVEAWIQRDDPAFGSRAMPSSFGAQSASRLRSDGTLSDMAHAGSVLAVGGYERDTLHPRQGALDDNGGEGPGRAGHAPAGPELIAPSNDARAAFEGVLSWGVHSGEWLRLAGTSAAAATVTRRIYGDWVAALAAGAPLPVGAAAIKAALQPDLPFDAAKEPLSRVGRGRVLT